MIRPRKPSMSPATARRLHIAMIGFWGLQMAAVAVVFWPPDWKMYLLEVSLYANFATHLAAHAAERPSEVVST